MDEIVHFNRLTKESFRRVASLMLTELKAVMAERDMELSWDDALLDYLTEKGFSETYGARNLQRLIQKEIEDIIAGEIIDKHQGKVSHVGLTAKNSAVEILAI